MAVMHKEKQLHVDLEAADSTGLIGVFQDTMLGVWADATDGAGKTQHVSQSGMVIIDKTQKLIKCGRSLAMMHGIWLEHEDWFNQLLETATMHQKKKELMTITFPQYKSSSGFCHHLKIKLDLDELILIMDNKMFGTVHGKVQGSGRCRLHMVEPVPIQLSDCVGLHRPTDLVKNLEWRVETLHIALVCATLFLNCPSKNQGFFRKVELVQEIIRLRMDQPYVKDWWVGMSDATAARICRENESLAGLSKTQLQQLLQDVYKVRSLSWKDLKLDGSKTLMPRKIEEAIQWARKATGQVAFPILTANNPWATRKLLETAKSC